MAKSTQNKAQTISFALRVFRRIKSEGRLPSGKGLGCSNSNVSYHSRKLISLGIIEKSFPSGGIYKVLVSEYEAIKRLKNNTKRKFVTTTKSHNVLSKFKRVHSIQAKLILPKFDYWFNILPKYLDRLNLPYDINGKGQIRLTMQYQELKHTFLLCKECIIFYLPNGKDFISEDTDFAMELVKIYITQLLTKFCGYFGKDLRIKGKFKFDITRKHIAMMDNEIAKDMHKRKTNIEVWVDGKLRVITDNSFNFDELEAITNKKAIPDVKRIQDHIKDVIVEGHTISSAKNEMKELIDNESRALYHSLKEMQEVMSSQTKLLKKQQEAISVLVENDSRSFNMQRYIN